MPELAEEVMPETAQGCLERRAHLIKEARDRATKSKADNNGEINAEDEQVIKHYMTNAGKILEHHNKLIRKESTSNLLLALDEAEGSLDRPANNRITAPGFNGDMSSQNSRNGGMVVNWTNGWGNCRASRMNRRLALNGPYAQPTWRNGMQNYLAGYGEDNQILGPDGEVLAQTNKRQNGPGKAKNAVTTIQTAEDERAGYFVLSEQMVADIIKNVDDDVFIQSRARVFQCRGAKSLGIRRRKTKADMFNWGAELSDATLNMESSLTYGKRSLTPYYMTGAFRLSRDLVRMAEVDVEAMVIGELMIDLREFIEDAYLNGTGVQRPLGVLVADAEGISTGRDVTLGTSGGNTFTFNTLLKAKYTLKPKYRNNSVWLFHPDRIYDIATFRSDSGAGAGTGQYLWQPSRQVGEPDVLLGIPVGQSYFMPNATGSGAYFGMLADFSYYWVAMGLDMEMQRLTELRARTNEYEYLFRSKLDAMPILEEAFVRLKYT